MEQHQKTSADLTEAPCAAVNDFLLPASPEESQRPPARVAFPPPKKTTQPGSQSSGMSGILKFSSSPCQLIYIFHQDPDQIPSANHRAPFGCIITIPQSQHMGATCSTDRFKKELELKCFSHRMRSVRNSSASVQFHPQLKSMFSTKTSVRGGIREGHRHLCWSEERQGGEGQSCL